MQALIFNSGTGSRMGELTNNKPKCLLEVAEDVTILDLQIKRLMACDVTSFVITTGLYDEMIKDAVKSKNYGGDFVFVKNPLYDTTNYIYSMFLARESLDFSGGVITLHGDMVFDEAVLRGLISCDAKNAVVVNKGSFLSDKDFNAAVENSIVKRIGVGDLDATNFLLPIYKLDEHGLQVWFDAVSDFVADGKTSVYAENAFNSASREIGVSPFYIDIDKDFCMEIDNAEDFDLCRNKVGI